MLPPFVWGLINRNIEARCCFSCFSPSCLGLSAASNVSLSSFVLSVDRIPWEPIIWMRVNGIQARLIPCPSQTRPEALSMSGSDLPTHLNDAKPSGFHALQSVSRITIGKRAPLPQRSLLLI